MKESVMKESVMKESVMKESVMKEFVMKESVMKELIEFFTQLHKNETKESYKYVMKELFENYNDDYLCWLDERNEDNLRWELECKACYLGICENENCLG